jgi:hypothetical protein
MDIEYGQEAPQHRVSDLRETAGHGRMSADAFVLSRDAGVLGIS